ncbi:MAG: hypothetical protein A2167_01185 [Planctomycetes bacterium RBG_13_46_10]|nr:MAG: hypothetical protein A2167_01185 [Planctomycetes bacterium RBG_13_46_10]
MLFAPGPVEMEKDICEIASLQSLPYFRGPRFAETVMRVNEDIKYLFQTNNIPLPITASGTGMMEMALTNLLNPGCKVVVINGGSFGQKWVDMCRAFHINVLELRTELGKSPDMNLLRDMLKSDIDALLVNMHETSTGYLYDIEEIGRLTNERSILFIVDAVSSIGADVFRMDEWSVDCAMVSTQKALALLPGLGFIAFSKRALETIPKVNRNRYYFDALDYIKNMQRGMTPFTPAVISILQVEARMKQIKIMGLDNWIKRHSDLANSFRKDLLSSNSDFSIFPERCSNALTAVTLPEHVSANSIIAYMRDKYDWWFAPNPTKNDSYLRISHMGNLNEDVMKLVVARLIEAVYAIKKGDSA